MPDTPHQRYMTAHRAYQDHARACDRCTETPQCPEGKRKFETFGRLQDAYLTWQRAQQRRR